LFLLLLWFGPLFLKLWMEKFLQAHPLLTEALIFPPILFAHFNPELRHLKVPLK
jgi:hypothetical protein